MILYDPALNMNFQDYGIMLPIAPDRGKQILEFMNSHYYPGTRGATMPYPGPAMSIADALEFLGIADRTIITRADLERVHSKEFVSLLYDKQKKGLEESLLNTFELIDAQGKPNRYEPARAKKPLSDLFQTILAQVGGTYLACRLALANGPGFCYFMGGGMHHARYDSGSGFCLINDSIIAITKLLSESVLPLIWIIDLDVHKGDGSAELIHFARERGELQTPPKQSTQPKLSTQLKLSDPSGESGNKKPCVLTLSIHMAKGWPLDTDSLAAAKEGRAPLVSSDIDIGIDAGKEETYTSRLAEGISELERLSTELYPSNPKPDLVLVVDGADPYEHDELPSSILLKLSLEQCLLRDNYVYRYVMDRGIPSAWIQSGGYGNCAWEPPAHFLLRVKTN